jgi:CubicO group peptidase (beta-lactamase class C family)
MLAALTLAGGSACGGCADEATSRPALGPAIDIELHRSRARVPAIAWAAFSAGSRGTSTGAVGHADIEANVLATDATPFEVASIAKMVIGVAVMQLVDEKRVSLDEDISSWVGFSVRAPGARTPITLRHLLTHTSSIIDGPETAAKRDVELGDFLHGYLADAGASSVFLDASPGAVASYSNVGPSLAAFVVERVTHMRFADRVAMQIFEPLGMTTAFFLQPSARPPRPTATPYASRGTEVLRLAPPSHALYPVVDMFASARDLVRFGRAIVRGGELDGVRILRTETVAEMLHVPFDAAPDDALGFQVRTFGGARVFGHEGEDVGASTGLYIDLAAHTGAVVLANGDAFHSEDPVRTKALGDLVEKLLRHAACVASAVAPENTQKRSPDGD